MALEMALELFGKPTLRQFALYQLGVIAGSREFDPKERIEAVRLMATLGSLDDEFDLLRFIDMKGDK